MASERKKKVDPQCNVEDYDTRQSVDQDTRFRLPRKSFQHETGAGVFGEEEALTSVTSLLTRPLYSFDSPPLSLLGSSLIPVFVLRTRVS
jgi:hypothetical protein